MLVVTSSEVAGRRIVETLGLVRGNTIRARHVGTDVLAGLRNLVGGEMRGYTRLLTEAREEALRRMTDEATKLGADAIVDVRLMTAQVTGGAAEILAYGTAVRLSEETRATGDLG